MNEALLAEMYLAAANTEIVYFELAKEKLATFDKDTSILATVQTTILLSQMEEAMFKANHWAKLAENLTKK